MSEAVLACLADLAGQKVSVAAATVVSDDGLLPPEPSAVIRAIPKRRAEFAAGRRAARDALRRAGLPIAAIPQGKDRAPIWPDGVVGSITHDAGLALAAVAPRTDIGLIGIDLVEAQDFPSHLRNEVLKTPAERTQSGLEARLSFSAKETVFKAFYHQEKQFFGFDAVEITPEIPHGTFSVRLRQALGSAGQGEVFHGRFSVVDKRLITCLTL